MIHGDRLNASSPRLRAESVLRGRLKEDRRRGLTLLDGRPVDLRRLVAEANALLVASGESPIIYPGLSAMPRPPRRSRLVKAAAE